MATGKVFIGKSSRAALALAASLCGLGTYANAEYVAWTGNGGSSDIGNAANYNKNVADLQRGIGGFPTGTYSLGADIAIARMVANVPGADVTFDLGAARTLTFAGTDGQRAFRATEKGNGATFRISSGTVRQVYDPASYTYTDGGANAIWQISSEATHDFTNIFTGANTSLESYRLVHGYGTNNWLVVRDGASVHADLHFGNGTGFGNVILIDSATLRLASASNNITTTGSDLGFFCVGINSKSSGDTLILANGGRLLDKDGNDVSKWLVGYSSPNVRLAFRGNGTTHTTSGMLKLGVGAKGSNACVEVSDGACLTLGGTSNGRFWLGCENGADGTQLSVSGTGTRLVCESTGNYMVGQDTDGNVFSVADGATATLAGIVRLGSHAGKTRNVVSVTGGASLSVRNNVFAGYETNANYNVVVVAGDGSSLAVSGMLSVGRDQFPSYGNGLVVSNGASVTAAALSLYGTNSVLCVDDATVSVSGEMHLPAGGGPNGFPCIRIAGRNARVSADATLRIRRNAELFFDVPAGGYAAAPLASAGRVEIIGNSTMSFDVEKFYQGGGGDCVLVETTGADTELYVEAGTLAAIQASLPSGCTIRVRDRKQLVLHVPKCAGMAIIFR